MLYRTRNCLFSPHINIEGNDGSGTDLVCPDAVLVEPPRVQAGLVAVAPHLPRDGAILSDKELLVVVEQHAFADPGVHGVKQRSARAGQEVVAGLADARVAVQTKLIQAGEELAARQRPALVHHVRKELELGPVRLDPVRQALEAPQVIVGTLAR